MAASKALMVSRGLSHLLRVGLLRSGSAVGRENRVSSSLSSYEAGNELTDWVSLSVSVLNSSNWCQWSLFGSRNGGCGVLLVSSRIRAYRYDVLTWLSFLHGHWWISLSFQSKPFLLFVCFVEILSAATALARMETEVRFRTGTVSRSFLSRRSCW